MAAAFKNVDDKSSVTVHGKICLRPRNSRNISINNGDIEIEIMAFPKAEGERHRRNISTKTPVVQVALKRPYSTMSETNSLGITLSEYKHASKFSKRL